MSSSTEYAAGPGAPAASEDSGGDEPKAREVDTGFDELRRESAAMLRTLADKYDSESEDSRARSTRLLAESEAAGALAVQLAEESVRIRTEADRLAAQPTWLAGAPDASAEPKVAQASSSSSGEVGAAAGDVTSTDTGATTPESGATPPPGPGPARGFAPNVSSASTPPGATGAAGTPTSPNSESDDWAPRPFESWRNQASQVNPRLLEL